MYSSRWHTLHSKHGLTVCLPQERHATEREVHWGRHALRSVVCRTATAEPGLQASLQELDALLVRCSTDCNAVIKPVLLGAEPVPLVSLVSVVSVVSLVSSRQGQRLQPLLLTRVMGAAGSPHGSRTDLVGRPMQAKQGPEAEAKALQLMEQLKARGEVRGFGGAQQVSGAGARLAPCDCLCEGTRHMYHFALPLVCARRLVSAWLAGTTAVCVWLAAAVLPVTWLQTC